MIKTVSYVKYQLPGSVINLAQLNSDQITTLKLKGFQIKKIKFKKETKKIIKMNLFKEFTYKQCLIWII